MATGLRLEDRLDGAGNFVPWKDRLVLILEKMNFGVKWFIVLKKILFKLLLPSIHKH